ncbi:MAG: RsmD family RNA methyltransferase [Acidimicrobiales bacterium]
MRVVAGTARGLQLVAPDGTDVRPTTNRVREATFNALYSLGVVDRAVVWDLFAGTGAMAIEALSRGAAHAHIIERSSAAIDAIEINLDTTKLASQASVHRLDAFAFLANSAERFGLAESGDEARLIAIVDPPYQFDEWAELLELLENVPGLTVVIESGQEIDPGKHWSIVRSRRYGGSVVMIMEPDRDDYAL